MKPDLPIDTQILWLAAELIERRGHCKGVGRTDDGGVCAMIAIHDANSILGASSDQIAYARLRAKIGAIIFWNDHPSRTAEEVALALRTA